MTEKLELQFEDNEYYLVDGNTNDTIGTTDKVLLKEDGNMKKLSLRNCENIKYGYDLDELVEDNFKGLRDCISDSDMAEFYINLVKTTITEILGDKKFSEEDIIQAHYQGVTDEPLYKVIQSLQQTEWDVEVETIEYGLGNDEDGRPIFETRFLLDADGCLILIRK